MEASGTVGGITSTELVTGAEVLVGSLSSLVMAITASSTFAALSVSPERSAAFTSVGASAGATSVPASCWVNFLLAPLSSYLVVSCAKIFPRRPMAACVGWRSGARSLEWPMPLQRDTKPRTSPPRRRRFLPPCVLLLLVLFQVFMILLFGFNAGEANASWWWYKGENLQVVIILLRAIAFLDLKYSIFVTINSILIGHCVPW